MKSQKWLDAQLRDNIRCEQLGNQSAVNHYKLNRSAAIFIEGLEELGSMFDIDERGHILADHHDYMEDRTPEEIARDNEEEEADFLAGLPNRSGMFMTDYYPDYSPPNCRPDFASDYSAING